MKSLLNELEKMRIKLHIAPKSLMKEVHTDKAPPPKIKNLQPEPAKVDRPVVKPIKSIIKPKEKYRVSMADIAKESSDRFDKVLKESPTYTKPGKL